MCYTQARLQEYARYASAYLQIIKACLSINNQAYSNDSLNVFLFSIFCNIFYTVHLLLS